MTSDLEKLCRVGNVVHWKHRWLDADGRPSCTCSECGYSLLPPEFQAKLAAKAEQNIAEENARQAKRARLMSNL